MGENQGDRMYIITDLTIGIVAFECINGKNTFVCTNCDFSPKEGFRKGCCNFGKDDILKILRSTPFAPSDEKTIKFNSTELLLLAHDEWKRREERRHIHPEGSWVAGFLNGFATNHKWAREHIDKIFRDGEMVVSHNNLHGVRERI